MNKEIFAKSNGITLKDHSELVSRIAVKIAKKTLLEPNETLIEGIRLSGLLHDIGKCTSQFQKKLSGLSSNDENLNSKLENLEAKLPYRHNEVGWAFLSRYLHLSKEVLSVVLDSVYWHHGISNKMSDYTDTKITLQEADIKVMVGYLSSIVSGDNISEKPHKPKKAPRYYITEEINEDAEDINAQRLFTRTCIISADRLASSLEKINVSDDEIDALIDISNLTCADIDISKYKYFGNERFNLQINVVDHIGKTTQINAPAGFGKTVLGLLWAFTTQKKLIWVCPRNIVAESVYKSILSELESFGIDDLSVELYLTGEVKESNKNFRKEFSSDIVITNIDSYLSPSVDSRHGDRLFTIIDSNVVFDEFHELIGESGLFACFINIMRTRNRLTKANTLLLSATPTAMHFLWDSLGQKTLVLPNKTSHFPAPHTKPYKINITDELKFDNTQSNNLVIVNAVSNAQRLKKATQSEMLLHSYFEDSKKHYSGKKLYEYYGKSSDRNAIKPNVVGTHIIQASLDVSFNHLYESVLSPQGTLQRIGRCDRWGDYANQSSINITRLDNNAETSIRRILYTNNLSNSWFEFLRQHNGKELTLDDLYVLYNEFEYQNAIVLKRYLIDKLLLSLEQLSEIYPVKFFNSKKSDVKTAGGNKLRCSNSEVFVICKYHDATKFSEPFSVQIRNSFNEEFDEGPNIEKALFNTMKGLRDGNDSRYDYNDILNNKYIGIDGIRKFAKKSDTPYIRFDKVYHPEYGVINEEILKQLLN